MNKKKIIKIGIPVAAGCIVLALGIGFAVKNSGKAVKVAPVSSMNSGGWYDDSGIASYGTVTTNQKQDIYVDDTTNCITGIINPEKNWDFHAESYSLSFVSLNTSITSSSLLNALMILWPP